MALDGPAWTRLRLFMLILRVRLFGKAHYLMPLEA